MTSADNSTGRAGFVERHSLWTEEQQEAGRHAGALVKRIDADGIETVSVCRLPTSTAFCAGRR